MLVDLIRQDDDVGVGHELLELLEIVCRPYAPRRVVGRVEDDHPGAVRETLLDPFPVNAVAGRLQGHVDGHPAAKADGRNIAVVGRLEDHHFVAFAHDGGDRGEDRLGRPCGDGDLAVHVEPRAVEVLHLLRNRFAQLGHALHRRVLVDALAHPCGDAVDEPPVRRKVREPLAQVDGTRLPRQRRHLREDRRALVRQLGLDRRGKRRHVGSVPEAGDGPAPGTQRKRSPVFFFTSLVICLMCCSFSFSQISNTSGVSMTMRSSSPCRTTSFLRGAMIMQFVAS